MLLLYSCHRCWCANQFQIIRHEDLAHIMAEEAVGKFMMMIQKVTHWSHCSRQAEKRQSLHPFFSLILSHGIFIINRNSLHIVVCLIIYQCEMCKGPEMLILFTRFGSGVGQLLFRPWPYSALGSCPCSAIFHFHFTYFKLFLTSSWETLSRWGSCHV